MRLLLLTVALLYAVGCARDTGSGEERRAGVAPSAELAPHMAAARALMAASRVESSSEAVLRLAAGIDAAVQGRSTRATGADSLLAWSARAPSSFVWIELANGLRYLAEAYLDYPALASIPPRNDPHHPAHVFWRASINRYSGSATGSLETLADRGTDLPPLDRVVLRRHQAAALADRGEALAAVRLLLADLGGDAVTGGAWALLPAWRDIAHYLTSADRLDDAWHAAATATALARHVDDRFQDIQSGVVLGEVLAARGETDAALARWRDDIDAAEQAGYSWVLTNALDQAAMFAGDVGRPRLALQFDLHNVAVTRAQGDSLNAPRAMTNVAHDYRVLGRLDSSRVFLDEARRWVDRYDDLRNKAHLPLPEAEHAAFAGNYALAESLLMTAAAEVLGASPHAVQMKFLVNQIKLGRDLGRTDLAYQALRNLDAMRGRLTTNLSPNMLADLDIATADFLALQGEFVAATEALGRAAIAVESRGGEGLAFELARSRGDLALLRDDWQTAHTAYTEAHSLARSEGAVDREANSRNLLARVALRLGNTQKARALFAVDSHDTAFGGRFRTARDGDLVLALADLQDRRPVRAVQRLDRALTRCGTEAPADLRARLRATRGRAHARLDHAELAETDLLAAWSAITAGHGGPTQIIDAPIRREIIGALLALWHDEPALLGGDTAAARALSWTLSAWWGRDAGELASSSGVTVAFFLDAERSFQWVITNSTVAWFVLPGREALREQLAPVLTDLALPERPIDVAAAASLGSVLLGPALPHWSAGGELRVLADGLTWSVPYAALPDPDTADGRPLLLRGPICLVSGRGHATTSSDHRSAPRRSVIAIGFDGTSERGGPQLRQAEAEAGRVISHWPEDQCVLRTGPDASWTRIQRDGLEDYAVIHVASHAHIYQGAPDRSTLRLADPDHASVTPAAIRKLYLQAPLVFLSSCQSTQASGSAAGGLAHFAGAFLEAGASTVIAASESVDDVAAAALADAFYRAWLTNHDAAAALRTAALAVRNDANWHHPFYWGHYRVIVSR